MQSIDLVFGLKFVSILVGEMFLVYTSMLFWLAVTMPKDSVIVQLIMPYRLRRFRVVTKRVLTYVAFFYVFYWWMEYLDVITPDMMFHSSLGVILTGVTELLITNKWRRRYLQIVVDSMIHGNK